MKKTLKQTSLNKNKQAAGQSGITGHFLSIIPDVHTVLARASKKQEARQDFLVLDVPRLLPDPFKVTRRWQVALITDG